MADRDYSTLEAVNLGYQPLRNHETPTADSGKQVVTDNAGKEVIKPYNDGIELTSNQQYSTATKDYHELLVDEQQHPERSRKWWWIGGVILLLVILGAVLGGVLGTRKGSKSSSSPPGSNSTTPSNATLVHNIAALALETGTVENTRIYYQDNAGMLFEAAKSDNSPWEFTEIEQLEKKNSTLAASVSRPGFPMVRYFCYGVQSLTVSRKSVSSTPTIMTSFTMSSTIPPLEHGAKACYLRSTTKLTPTPPCRLCIINADSVPIPQS